MAKANPIKTAPVHIEETPRGFRFSLAIPGARDTLSMLSYKTVDEAKQAAERYREHLMGLFY